MQTKLVKASIWAKTRGLVDESGSLWVYENEIFGVAPSIRNEVAILVKAST